MSYDPFPKYLQIREIILRWMSTLEVGYRFPSEDVLAKQFSVSRLTLRQALRTLEEDKLISRRAGVGTQLIRLPKAPLDSRLTGPIEGFSGLGLNASAQLIHEGPLSAPPDVAMNLGIAEGTRIYGIDRLRLINAAPLLWLEVYMPLALGKKVAKTAVAGFFVPVIRQLHDADVREQFQTIEALSATAEQAARLDIAPQAPILSVNRLFVDSRGKPVVYFKTRFRADRYYYTVNLPSSRPAVLKP